uniref:Uncharacterized protein n=1 Tax=Arundo donax TaxID=35708 RepID=A0A0A9C0V5_ARUDO
MFSILLHCTNCDKNSQTFSATLIV